MPRISRLTRNEVSEGAAVIYDRVLRDRGNVPNMFRTMAHRPQIFETIIAHMDAVLKTGTLSTALKELVIATELHGVLSRFSHDLGPPARLE